MTKEIEKKYLIREDGTDHTTGALLSMYASVDELKHSVMTEGKTIRQGYIPLESGQELCKELGIFLDFLPTEARLRDKGGKKYFTLKGKGGLERNEAESDISDRLFNAYWPKTEGNRVEKVRLKRPCQGHSVEIDVYTDRDLVVAEIEVPSLEEASRLEALGKDVTEDKSYKNKNLAR
jgi:CYTH domain-containing protein